MTATVIIRNNMLVQSASGKRCFYVRASDIGKVFINDVDSGDGSFEFVLPEIPGDYDVNGKSAFADGWGGLVVFSNYQQNNVIIRDQGRVFTAAETGDTTREGRSTVSLRHQSWGEWDIEGRCTTER